MSPRAAWRLESLGFSKVFDYVAGKADWMASGLPVEGKLADYPRAGSVARTDIPTCRLTDRLGDARDRTLDADQNVCVVVNDDRIVLGRLRGDALRGDPGRPWSPSWSRAPPLSLPTSRWRRSDNVCAINEWPASW